MSSEIRCLKAWQNRLCQRDAFASGAGNLREVESDRNIALRHAHLALADPHGRLIADTQRFRWLSNEVPATQPIGDSERRACNLAVLSLHGKPKVGSLAVSFRFYRGAGHVLGRVEHAGGHSIAVRCGFTMDRIDRLPHASRV